MLVLAPASGWSGRARRCVSSGALALLLLSGCANLPADWPLYSALDFWDASVEGSEAERDALWDEAQALDLQWRIALLQSLPDYRRFNPQQAQRGLEEATKVNPYDDIAAIARIRLAEMRNGHTCRVRKAELEERLGKIIAIEKGLEQDAR
jgi:hypothetical protein